ncbi:unnamed protein product [Durusdinium trenchii]|uniref:Uncharacterized protein n=2 Tax=Durusdinium trenchii TaxID=1381693 RepID=A0ABP0SXA7_9DINO
MRVMRVGFLLALGITVQAKEHNHSHAKQHAKKLSIQEQVDMACHSARTGNLEQLQSVELLGSPHAWKATVNAQQCVEKWTAGTLLHEAATAGRLEFAQRLVQNGASISVKDTDGWTPFARAVMEGHLTLAVWLMEQGAMDLANYEGETVLIWASKEGRLELCRWLCGRGSAANAVDAYGNTALLWAIREGHVDVVRWLLTRDVDLEAVDPDGCTALAWAAKRGRTEMAEALLEHGAWVNSKDKHGYTPLVWAAKTGDMITVKLLIEKGADLLGATSNGTPYFKVSNYANINEYIFLNRFFAMAVPALLIVALASLVGLGAALAQQQLLALGAHTQQLLHRPPPTPRTPRSAPSGLSERRDGLDPVVDFSHGAALRDARDEKNRFLLYWGYVGHATEVEVMAILIFGFGMGVVWWVYWLPLHLFLYGALSLQRWRITQLWCSPSLLLTTEPRFRALMASRSLFLLAVVLWSARPEHCGEPTLLTWARYLCAAPTWSLPLADPDWAQLLVKQTMVWDREAASDITGMYFLMLFLGLLFYVPYNIFMILRGEQGSVFHKFQPMRLDSASEEFKRKLWMEVALLLLDVLLQFNTVCILLWTNLPKLAFLLTCVISRSLSLQMLSGNLSTVSAALQDSLRYGMLRKDLMEVFAEARGSLAFLSLCLTSYSYWYGVQNTYQANTLLMSLILSTHHVANFLHERVDLDLDLELPIERAVSQQSILKI